jgi:Zn-finger nucleic acid-binding protein
MSGHRQTPTIKGIKLDLNRHLTCPRCRGNTHPFNYGDDTGIIIDQCGACHGVWLDRGELEKIQELVEGWEDELPEDLAQYGPKLRQISADEDKDLDVHISHVHLINSLINGILDFFSERPGILIRRHTS